MERVNGATASDEAAHRRRVDAAVEGALAGRAIDGPDVSKLEEDALNANLQLMLALGRVGESQQRLVGALRRRAESPPGMTEDEARELRRIAHQMIDDGAALNLGARWELARRVVTDAWAAGFARGRGEQP